MSEQTFDVVVVGGGPGGYVAAIRAAQLGLKAALVEREHVGGICLNWGCIPTKALLRSAEVFHLMTHAKAYGLSAEHVTCDLAAIVQRSRNVAGQLQNGVKHLLKTNKVKVFDGHAKLDGPGRLAISEDDVRTQTVVAQHIILATGARARILKGLEPDGDLIWTYKEAMVPKALPKRLLVVGAGAIGIEFASFYNMLGAQVTVIEAMDRILPVEDAEISALARKAFEKRGMTIHTGALLKGMKKGAETVTASIDQGGTAISVTVDRVVLAMGITGNVKNLGLEGTGVQVENSHIVTDAWGRTGEPGVYAIGDVAGAPWLAHKASHEGIVCVEKIAGVADVHAIDNSKIPGCTYSYPQIASVGLTEAKAKERGHEVRVGRFPFIGNGKAIALGEPEGMVKTVFDAKSGELLGAHMVGAEVTEMIQGYGIARTLEATEADLMHTVFPHPSLSEMMHESVLDAFGRAIHK